jgi:hypothetical protein
MAKLFNSNQPKWLYFCNEEDTTKRQQFAVAVGSNPEHIQIKSQSQGFVYVQFKDFLNLLEKMQLFHKYQIC